MTDVLLFVGSSALAVLHRKRKRWRRRADDGDDDALKRSLEEGTSLSASERICLVTPDNAEVPGGALRSQMRLRNLWHRATYVLVLHAGGGGGSGEAFRPPPAGRGLSEVTALVQRRSRLKDYCPGRLDPLPGGVVGCGESYRQNAIRELEEEMGITNLHYVTGQEKENGGNGGDDDDEPVVADESTSTLQRLFTFQYENSSVRVWGDFYQCVYRGDLEQITLQEEEVESLECMTLQELADKLEREPDEFMPDAVHAMKLYFQRLGDMQVKRRLLPGYSFGDTDSYQIRPKPAVVFFDCDDCLYFDGWKTADHLTAAIDKWCVEKHGLPSGYAYELYKKYGTALRGLLAEGYLENSEQAIDGFLQAVHDIPVHDLLQPDQELRQMLLRMDPSVPRYIFTASVRDHAMRCLQALGIADLFVDIIDCKRCELETKHSPQSFEIAMQAAGVNDPEHCLLLDDSLTNVKAARKVGWRSVLVGRVGRDCGKPVTSEHAELEIDRIHHVPTVLPELFVDDNDSKNGGYERVE
jgi:putative hydrolase of the HAD superfamily/pyrimidine and pyridine-specific 5'-nucleotidase